MELTINNINIVKHAEIKLNGLTVIAGENGTGKSTVGKVLFSTIKALSNSMYNSESQATKGVQKYVNSIYRRLSVSRQFSGRLDSTVFPRLTHTLVRRIDGIVQDTSVEPEAKKRLIHDLVISLRKYVEDIEDITPRIKSLIYGDLDNLKICATEVNNIAAQLFTEINYLIESEFMNRIMLHDTTEASVKLEDNDIDARVSYKIKDNTLDEINTHKIFELFEDATYVESPLYLHIIDVLLAASTYREISTTSRPSLIRGMVPVHIKDLSEKIYSARFVNNIQGTIGMTVDDGMFKYEKDKLVYEKKGKQYSPINIASGLKAFGVLQLLQETGNIGAKKILIWDEPENHLHPKWQTVFAEQLVRFAQKGIPVVVSTHSPYIIQAIRYHSASCAIENFVNYYFSDDRGNGYSEIKDITQDLNYVFRKLAGPLNDVMNVDLARSKKTINA